jgi:hypothetical protein
MLSDDEIEAIAQERLRKNYPADCEIIFRSKKFLWFELESPKRQIVYPLSDAGKAQGIR